MRYLILMLALMTTACTNPPALEPPALDLPAGCHLSGNDLTQDTWPTAELALDVWPDDLLTDRCVKEAPRIRWVVLPRDLVVGELCSSVGARNACFRACGGDPLIMVSDDLTAPDVPAHELAHWLYSCSDLGASNDNHNQELFQDTVEGILAAVARR